jgi:hypothetical protein
VLLDVAYIQSAFPPYGFESTTCDNNNNGFVDFGQPDRTPYTPHIPVKPLQLLHMFIKFNKNLEMVGDAAPVCLLGLQIPDLGLYVFVEKE